VTVIAQSSSSEKREHSAIALQPLGNHSRRCSTSCIHAVAFFKGRETSVIFQHLSV